MPVNVFIIKYLNNRKEKIKSEIALLILSAIFTLLPRANTLNNMLHIL